MLNEWNELRNWLRGEIQQIDNDLGDVIMRAAYYDVFRKLDEIENRSINESLRGAGY